MIKSIRRTILKYGVWKREVQWTENKCPHATLYLFEYYPKLENHVVNKYFSENYIYKIKHHFQLNYIYSIMLGAKKHLKSN